MIWLGWSHDNCTCTAIVRCRDPPRTGQSDPDRRITHGVADPRRAGDARGPANVFGLGGTRADAVYRILQRRGGGDRQSPRRGLLGIQRDRLGTEMELDRAPRSGTERTRGRRRHALGQDGRHRRAVPRRLPGRTFRAPAPAVPVRRASRGRHRPDLRHCGTDAGQDVSRPRCDRPNPRPGGRRTLPLRAPRAGQPSGLRADDGRSWRRHSHPLRSAL